MIDLDRELRALLEEEARSAPPAPDARAAIRRTRRRQVGVVLTALAVVAAVAVGSIAGVSALIRSAPTPAEPPDRFSPGALEAVASQPISFEGLVADTDGNLWSRGPGLTRFDPASGSIRTFTIADDPAFVAGIAPAHAGGVWVLSPFSGEQRVRRVDVDGTLETSVPVPAHVEQIAEAPDGTVWASGDGGVLHWRDGSWVEITTEGRPSTWAGAIAVDPSGNVWVANHTEPDAPGEGAWLGVSRFDGVRWTTYPEDELFPPDLVPADAGINVIAPVSDADVWVGGGGAVAHLVNGSWTSYRSAELGLASVASIAVTDGEVWTAGGFPRGGPPAIARFDGTTWAPVVEGLEGSGAEPVELTPEGGAVEYTRVVAGQGEIWATTEAGLYRSDGSRWQRVFADERPLGVHDAIAATGADELWMADPNGFGVWRLQGDRWTHIGESGGAPGGWSDLVVTGGGTVWVSGWFGLASFDGTGWDRIDTEGHSALALGPDGEAWTATDPEGDPGQPGTIVGPVGGAPIPEPAPVYPVSSLALSGRDDVWIGSSGNWGPYVSGLAHYDGTGWTRVTPFEGEPDFYVYDIELAPGGDVWVSLGPWDRSGSDAPTEHLVAHFDGSTWRTFGPGEGVPQLEEGVPQHWGGDLELAPDGTMLLASESGLFEVRDDTLTPVQDGWFDGVSIASDGTIWLWSVWDGLFRLPNA